MRVMFTSTVRGKTMTSSGHTAESNCSRENTFPRFSRKNFRISYSVFVKGTSTPSTVTGFRSDVKVMGAGRVGRFRSSHDSKK